MVLTVAMKSVIRKIVEFLYIVLDLSNLINRTDEVFLNTHNKPREHYSKHSYFKNTITILIIMITIMILVKAEA